MSNVTIHDIVRLTAEAFGVTHAEMRANHSKAPRGPRFLDRPPSLSARRVAAYLAHRHTTLQWRQIAAVLSGSPADARSRMREDAETVAFLIGVDADLARVVEAIESAIDDVHDARESLLAPCDSAPRSRPYGARVGRRDTSATGSAPAKAEATR